MALPPKKRQARFLAVAVVVACAYLWIAGQAMLYWAWVAFSVGSFSAFVILVMIAFPLIVPVMMAVQFFFGTED